jgi:CheY-like chemotaxis protein
MTQIPMPAYGERSPWAPFYRAQTGPSEHHTGHRRDDERVVTRHDDRMPTADQRLTVLVAEDEPSIGCLVLDILEAAGYRVALAQDGHAALALASSERPALVLTDRMMPELGGIDLVRRLRANPATRALPVALMSATRAGVTHAPAERGKTDTAANTQYIEIDGELVPFLPKPFELDELVGLVDALAHEPDERRSAQPAGSH